MLVEALQIRKATGRHTVLSAVPAGLPPLDHFREGCQVASPLDSDPEVPHDIEFCLQKIKELGPGIHQWRLNQIEIFKAFLKKHSDWEFGLNTSRSFASFKCSSHVNISANIAAAAVIGWPDDKLQELIAEGAKPMGPQPDYNIYRRKSTFASLSFESLLTSHNILETIASKTPPPKISPKPFGKNRSKSSR